jgi:hypothetical protein
MKNQRWKVEIISPDGPVEDRIVWAESAKLAAEGVIAAENELLHTVKIGRVELLPEEEATEEATEEKDADLSS